jgi:outer membrane protein assembly factor BamD (BamD/ComL family)
MKVMFFIVCLGLAFTACGSNSQISADLTPMELIQRGQEASDKNKYKRALQYYGALIERYPSYIDEICAGEYEIAFIHYKQKKYDAALAEFNALLSRYDTPDAELLPPQFKRLAEIQLQKIEAKQGKKKK